jgi:hypothetical protein
MVQVGSAAATQPGFRFVDWAAVFAGAVTAAALSFVLLTFGTAIGLTTVSPWPNSGVSAKTAASLAVFWTLAQQIGAFMIGGYIAGRLRARWAEANEDETEFRDGLHGALVWSIGIAFGAIMLFAAAGAAARTGVEALSKVATAATNNADTIAYYADALMRPAARPATSQGTAAQGAGTAATPARVEPLAQETRAEIGRIVARSVAAGSLTDSDRGYLATIVAQRTGLPQAEAERRVNETITEATRATREAADKARRAAVLGGLVTAISLMVSLGAAWWAAQKGGNHRDQRIPARFAFVPARRQPIP